MDGFVRVARETEVPSGHAMKVQVAERSLALFKVEGRLYATESSCLHLGGPLCEGSLEGNVVTCPWHQWKFDVTTGASLQSSRLFLKVFPVKVEAGEVFVAADPAKREAR